MVNTLTYHLFKYYLVLKSLANNTFVSFFLLKFNRSLSIATASVVE